jgi:putative ABC transport system substrate-binding protein
VNPASSHYVTVLRAAAQKLGVMLKLQAISDRDQLNGAFATIVAERAQALVVVVDSLTVRYRDRIVELAMNNRLPAMYGFREFVDAGGLIAYGVNVPYLCKISPGARPTQEGFLRSAMRRATCSKQKWPELAANLLPPKV